MLKVVYFIGLVECAIGVSTAVSILAAPWLSIPPKPRGVFYFVLVAALISLTIGAGLLKKSDNARKWLVYFSGYITIEKVLIFLGVIVLNNKVVSHIADVPIDVISLTYHAILVIFFTREPVKRLFKESKHHFSPDKG